MAGIVIVAVKCNLTKQFACGANVVQIEKKKKLNR